MASTGHFRPALNILFGRYHKWQQHWLWIGGRLFVSRALMNEKSPSPEKNTSDSPRPARKPYLKPEFGSERAFETMALSCGKMRGTQGLCRFNRKSS